MIITLYPKSTPGESIDIEIISVNSSKNVGFWSIDDNKVYLSKVMYDDFCAIEKQEDKKRFFGRLSKVGSPESLIKLIDYLPEKKNKRPLFLPR